MKSVLYLKPWKISKLTAKRWKNRTKMSRNVDISFLTTLNPAKRYIVIKLKMGDNNTRKLVLW